MPPTFITYPARLKERRHEYDDVFTFTFEKPMGLSFEAGNYVHIRIASVPEPHKPVREMSFASAPHDEDIVFTITTESRSPWQESLLALIPGDTIELFKIKGHLHAPERGALVMIAGGIGITPFRSIIRHVVHTGLPVTPTLIHSANGEYLYRDELEPLPLTQKRVTRTDSKETLSTTVKANPQACYMIAGSASFVESMSHFLIENGIPEDTIQTDAFKGLVEGSQNPA